MSVQKIMRIPSMKPGETHPVVDYPYMQRPKQMWTLLDSTPRELPIKLKHGETAFIESSIHDWDIMDGKLHYYSRFADGGCDVVLVFDEEPSGRA